jgi:hypothetical protein
MTRFLAGLALVGLMAAVAIEANIPGPVLRADRNRGEPHEQVSMAASRARRARDPAGDRGRVGAGARALCRRPGGAGGSGGYRARPDPDTVRTIDVGEISSHGTRELRHWDPERDDRIMAEYGLPHEPRLSYSLSPPSPF